MASIRATLFAALFGVLPLKSTFENLEKFHEMVDRNQRKGPARPPRWLVRKHEITQSYVDGHLVFTASPRKEGTGKQIVFLHGGGYVLNITSSHWKFIDRIIEILGASVTVPIYPLAPVAGWLEVSQFILSVYGRLAAAYGPQNIALMGDSAGGGLSLALAMALRDAGRPLPGHLVLLSPWLDVNTNDREVIVANRRDPMLGVAALRESGRLYAKDLGLNHPYISPLFGSMAGLPPLLVLAGTRDTLCNDARRLAEGVRAAGGNIDHAEYPHMIHDWMMLPIPEARRALGQIVAFLR